MFSSDFFFFFSRHYQSTFSPGSSCITPHPALALSLSRSRSIPLCTCYYTQYFMQLENYMHIYGLNKCIRRLGRIHTVAAHWSVMWNQYGVHCVYVGRKVAYLTLCGLRCLSTLSPGSVSLCWHHLVLSLSVSLLLSRSLYSPTSLCCQSKCK